VSFGMGNGQGSQVIDYTTRGRLHECLATATRRQLELLSLCT
jgi:hypothetical protein